jgi:transcription-repair coupling factor (superfamily II helicase)
MRPVLLAAEYQANPRKWLVVTPTYDRALAWQAKLTLAGVPHDRIRQLPSGIASLFEDAAPEHIALSDRLGALRALVEPEPWIVIATPQSALERTLPREILEEGFFRLKVGDQVELPRFTARLQSLGYEYSEPVRLPGHYSRRGGILDVYAVGRDTPLRLEFFDDEIESIRSFDANSQRSLGHVPFLAVAPSRETLPGPGTEELAEILRASALREATTLDDEAGEHLQELIGADADLLAQRAFFDRLDLYRPLIHPDSGGAVQLLAPGDALLLDDPIELDQIALRSQEELAQALEARARRGEILHSPAHDFLLDGPQLLHEDTLAMDAMGGVPDWLSPRETVSIGAVTLGAYRGRADALALTLRNYQRENLHIVITTDQPHRARTVLQGAELAPEPAPEIVQGNLAGGFVWPPAALAVVTDAELFGVARLKLPQRRFMEGAPIATVLDLKPGDYVVHINFGIGVFRGLVKREIEGVEKEFLYVEYQAPDKLFVPADQLDRIQKYLNPGDEQPKLNSLRGAEWQRTLGKAKEEAQAFARDLVKLYAQRATRQRRPYGVDTPFQTEMESTFPWVETPSQLQAIEEVKADMEQGHPMDRLVCGDVGFGKTEVAIRAAFKGVQSGRQVAVLCPTTILSEQHFRNFQERLGSFGTRLALINRFTHAADKRRTLTELAAGTIEILVGTHALLGQGIEFRDLGLVIVDEEQKFGVRQKEMLKHLRSEVDVLTLSATPIPRTLSMALMDIRQMSLINDPPPGRLPIRTHARPFSQEVVREAILRELARGGQVFYVYNRVDGIGHVAERLRKLVPNARIGVGHGQMTEKELEPIMVGFIKGEIDVLLSTTIIENGIDIGNANTLIVENADRLGLSQLYQLRGRVGRSDRQAYAYFLYGAGVQKAVESAVVPAEGEGRPTLKKKYASMTEGAMARLQALQEFSNLGSGYSLAFRDLQIRGAGELLGAKQSGTMVTVGYELYSQLIAEAVAQLKSGVDGERPNEIRDPLANLEPLPSFELPVVALIPDTYIKDQAQRLYYYQQMMSARDAMQLAAVQGEVEDRYGKLPEPVGVAFAVMALRMRAKALGIEKLDGRQGRLAVKFRDPASVPPLAYSQLAKRKREAYVSREAFVWPFAGSPVAAVDEMLSAIEEVLADIEAGRERLAALRG